METTSARIQKLIVELLSSGNEYSIKEIKDYLRSNGMSDYNEGHFSGSLYTMLQNGTIKKPKRGVYMINEGGGDEMKECFVVSPIGDAESDIRKKADKLFRYIIEPVCRKCGFKPVRVDQLNDANSITDTIISHLEQAELVIADISTHNPNVFYEMGFRARTKKPIIHLRTKEEALPFDITAIRTLEYDLTDLDSVEEVKERLEKTILSFDYSKTPDTASSKQEKEAKSEPLLPVLYQISDKIDRINAEIRNTNKEIIETVIKSMHNAQPSISAEAAMQMQLIKSMMQSPESFAKIIELSDKWQDK